ncbi:hypothetical protein [Cryobacterium sp. Hh11]|nr:hypothetical protein [Cryobacterium sp. Hh11]
MEIDWVNLAPIVAIIGGIVYAIFDQYFKPAVAWLRPRALQRCAKR